MLVEGLAVEASEGPLVFGEVGGNPVDEDADAGVMQFVDKRAQLVRGTPAGRWSIVAGDLVAPGAAERVLRYREKLHMGVAVLLEVGDELLAQGVIVGADLPRAHVQLVDAHRHIQVIRARGHPLRVAPREGGAGDHGGGFGRRDGALSQRIRLVHARGILTVDGKLVALALTHAGDKHFPHTGGAQGAHGELRGVPAAEISDYGYTFGVRRPHGEGGAGDLTHVRGVGLQVGAEHLPEALVAALTNQVQVQRAQGGQEVVAVGDLDGRLARVCDPQAVVFLNRQRCLPQVVARRSHGDGVSCGDQLYSFGPGAAGKDGACVPPVEIVRRVVAANIEAFKVGCRDVHTDQIT